MYLFLVIFMYAIWSTVFPLSKAAIEISAPLFLSATRFILAGTLFIGFLILRNRKALKLTFKQWLLVALLGITGTYLTNALEYWSIQYLSAAKTCFIYSLCPFFSALFSYFQFREKMTSRKWMGLLIGLAGVVPILIVQKGAEELLTTIPFLSWPELAMVAASACTVYGWVVLRRVLQDDVSLLMANGASMLIGGFVALTHSYLVENWNPIPVAPSHFGTFVEGVLILTVISNIFGFNLYGFLLKKFTATFLSCMGLLSPIFASLSSWLILGEPISTLIFFSTAIVTYGAWLVYSEELKQGYVVAA